MGFEEWGSILLSSAKREKKLCGLYGLSSRKTGNPKTNVTLNMDFNGCHLRDTCLQQEKPAKLGVRRERQQDGEKVGLQSQTRLSCCRFEAKKQHPRSKRRENTNLKTSKFSQIYKDS